MLNCIMVHLVPVYQSYIDCIYQMPQQNIVEVTTDQTVVEEVTDTDHLELQEVLEDDPQMVISGSPINVMPSTSHARGENSKPVHRYTVEPVMTGHSKCPYVIGVLSLQVDLYSKVKV